MGALLRKMTGDNSRLLMVPTVGAFIENASTMVPAVVVMLVIGALITALTPPFIFDGEAVWSYCVVMALAVMLQMGASILAYRYSYYSSQKAMANVRLGMVDKVRRLPLGYYATHESGQLIEAFVIDPDEIEKAISFYLPQVISMSVMSLLSFGILVFYDWRLALPMYAMLPVCGLCMWLAMRLRATQAASVAAARSHATTVLNEYVLGMRNLKSYNQTGSGFSRLDEAYERLTREMTKDAGMPGALTLLASHVIHFGIPLIIFVGSMLLIAGTIDLFWLLAFLVLSTRLYTPLASSITCLIQARTSLVSSKRVHDVMNHPVQPGDQDLGDVGDICFDDVCFSYRQAPVLDHVNAVVPQGMLTALVGPSGSGKSTILRLVARFWDVDSGDITIGDMPIGQIDPDKLYGNISMVFQENYLFGESIRSNIMFGQEHKTEKDMMAAARLACCHDFISALPQGYDTVVGEGGATLSGGEKQRIAIARAILKDAPILLLDEPTSSLDARNEMMVQRAISNMLKGRTVIMIAHRLKTIADADYIIVLERGSVAQAGTFDALMDDREGLFHHL